jgi:mannonate dehydratase
MHVGLGLGFRAELSPGNLRFARQAGATQIVASLLNGAPTAGAAPSSYVVSRSRPDRWSREALVKLRRRIEAEDLRLAAIESIEPADWYDVLIDGPRRERQLAGLKELVKNLGAAGIPILGFNFSLAGIWGREQRPVARGGATTWRFDDPGQTPIKAGMVWNQVYDVAAFNAADGGSMPEVTADELWGRLGLFLQEIVPVAEESGVRLALHPEDPPLRSLRATPRLVHSPQQYRRVFDLHPSPSNAILLCIGTVSETPGVDVYEAMGELVSTGRVAYVHFRNVRGKAPHYDEGFVDDGDTDMPRVLKILAGGGFDGVIVPDHTPELDCDAPWHAGMAYALGWMRASLAAIGALADRPTAAAAD